MKTVLLLILFLVSANLRAQEMLLNTLPLEGDKVTYSGVIEVEGTTKDELYKRAKIWLVDAYRSSKDVLQLEDKEDGTLIGKGYILNKYQYNIFYTYNVNLQHTIRLDFKDGKYKYSITDFILDYRSPASQYTSAKDIREPIEDLAKQNKGKSTLKYYQGVATSIKETIDQLQKAMKQKSKDW